MTPRVLTLVAVVGAAGLAAAADPQAPDLRVLTRQALDQPTQLKIDNLPLVEAFEQISEQTGIKLWISPFSLNLLPYGERTRVSIEIKGATLRQGMVRMLHPIGMEFEPRDDRVEVQPTPPLMRISRPATWEELDTLSHLLEVPWSPSLGETLMLQFQDTAPAAQKENRTTLLQLANSVGAGSAAEVLEHACDQFGWVWFPSGKYVAVVSKTRQMGRQLTRPVTVRYRHVKLQDVLFDLTRQAGVPLSMDPGAIASLPIQMQQNFSLNIANTSLRQALELVAGTTGLAYVIEAEGIRITTNPFGGPLPARRVATAPQPPQAANPYVGKIVIPSKSGRFTIEFLIRESDLPPELNARRKRMIKEFISSLPDELPPVAATADAP